MKIGRPFRDPFDEAGYFGMPPQCFWGVVDTGKFPFAEHAVYFPVTDRVNQDGFTPAFGFGGQVMFLGPGPQGPKTDWTHAVVHRA